MKKSLLISFSILGSLVGIGLASGKELLAMFGVNNKISLFLPFFIGLFFFIVIYIFLTASNSIKTNIDKELFGDYYFIPKTFLLLNSLIVLSTMLAGVDSLYNHVVKLAPLYSIITAVLVIYIVSNGINGIFGINLIFIPVIIIAIILISVFSINMNSFVIFFSFKIFSILNYVCFNILLSISLIYNIKNISKKEIVLTSIFTGFFIFIVLFFLSIAINGSAITSDMPILDIAHSLHPSLRFLIIIVLTFSILTTMCASLNNLIDNLSKREESKIFLTILIVSLAFIVSRCGFNNIISIIYPIFGLFGIFYTMRLTIYLYQLKKNSYISIKEFTNNK